MTVKTGKDLAEHIANKHNLTKTLAKEMVKDIFDLEPTPCSQLLKKI